MKKGTHVIYNPASKAVLCSSQRLWHGNPALSPSPSLPPPTLRSLTEKQETSAPAALLRLQLPTLEAEGGDSGFLPSCRGPSLKNAGWSQASYCAGWLAGDRGCSVLLSVRKEQRLTWSRGCIWLASSWLSLFFKVRAHLGHLEAWRKTQSKRQPGDKNIGIADFEPTSAVTLEFREGRAKMKPLTNLS